MKTILIAAGALATLAPCSAPSFAAPAGPITAHWTWSYQQAAAMRVPGGRCRGISYGTGARSCGTATGGPVAGLASRN